MTSRSPPKTSLRERLAWPSVLYQACAEATRGTNPDSAGSDGVTVDAFRRSTKAELAKLRQEIRNGRYAPSLGHGVAIPKKRDLGTIPDNVRPITVFNVRDRIVQRAISNLIWPHLRDHVFSEVSFGGIRAYRLGNARAKVSSSVRKNVESAALKIMQLRRDGYSFTFETDIQRFFPTIDKAQLLRQLARVLPDSTLDDLLEASVSTNIDNPDELEARGLSECWDPSVGVPQGGVLSPLLANFYLAPFDKVMMHAGFQLVRYVDDLVILTKNAADAAQAYRLCKSTLQEMGLTIHPLDEPNEKRKVKTRIVADNQPFEFLGLTFNKTSIHPSQSKLVDLRDRLRKATHARLGGATLIEVVTGLNRLLRGWMAAYAFCDLPRKVQTEIDRCAGRGLASWMVCHKLIRNENALTPEKQRKIGLWTVLAAQVRPISRRVYGLQNPQSCVGS
jgi:RNA-directed DNA polymerase